MFRYITELVSLVREGWHNARQRSQCAFSPCRAFRWSAIFR